MKRFTAILLVAVFVLASCSSRKSETVMSYGEASYDENLYFYELAMMKSELLQQYAGTTTDIPAFWAHEMAEGVTVDQYFFTECNTNMMVNLFFADHAIKKGGLNKEDEKKIDEAIDDIVEQYGSKAAVNKYLEKFTIDLGMYREYLELYALTQKGISLAYSDGGDFQISAERMLEYYKENFVTVKHIAIGTEYAGTDEEGNVLYYTDEEKRAKRELIESIKEGLENGGDFDEYYHLSEDGQAENYPDGYTITRGVFTEVMEGYEKVAFSLAEGEWDEFELEGTSLYIIKRVPLLESDFYNCANIIHSSLLEIDKAQRVVENFDGFYRNDTVIGNYNMAMIPTLS